MIISLKSRNDTTKDMMEVKGQIAVMTIQYRYKYIKWYFIFEAFTILI